MSDEDQAKALFTHASVMLATASFTDFQSIENMDTKTGFLEDAIAIVQGIRNDIKTARPSLSQVVIGHLACATANLVVKSCLMKVEYLYPNQNAKALVDESRRAVLRTFDGF